MTSRSVELTGGSPWGFRMHGGVDVNQPLRISRVNPGRKAALSGIREGDVISSINNVPAKSLTNAQAHAMLKNSGDILKLGLNEDSVGSPRRRSTVKANGLELKRPSQLLAEMQGIAGPQIPTLVKPETMPSVQTSPRITDRPSPSNPVSSFSSSSQNLFREIPPHSSMQYTSSNSLNRQISPHSSSQSASNCSLNQPVSHTSIHSSKHFNQTTSPSKFTQSSSILVTSPFDNEINISRNMTLIEPKINPSSQSNQLSLRSPSLPGSSPTKAGLSPMPRVSPFSSLESTSFVKSSIRPSITMPTITPPTVTFPSYSSSETDCNRITPQQYNNHNVLNSSVSSPFPSSSVQNPGSLQLFKSDVSNTTYSSLGYMPTFNAEGLMTSPRSPMNSFPYIPGSSQVSSTAHWPNSSVITYSNSPFVQSNPQISTSYLPQKDQTNNQYSSYFPLSNTPTFSNFSKPLTTTASSSPFLYSNTPPIINSAPISSTYSSKIRQPSPFSTTIPNNVQKTSSSTSPLNSKTSLSSITFPHYLLYSTPTTTIKSTNPFITNEYMVTKTEISEQSITETEEVTTTKKFSLNGYDEPSSQAFDKALSALRINGACNSDFRSENNDGALAPLSPYKPAEGKPPRTPQDFSPKKCDVKSDDDKFAESNAIISEAESDVEWEVADELLDNNKKCFHKIKGQLSVETIPLQKADAEEVNSLSPEDELNLRNFLQSLNLSATSSNPPKIPAEVPDIVVEEEQKEEKESENDIKLRRARNKAALEEHFLPQIVNPRFLDVIDEEGSSESSDTTRRQSFLNENRELHQRFEDIDDDVFVAEKKIIKEPKDVFPKNKDYFASKKELKRQQECLLVGAKILESAVEEGCGDWTIEKVEEQRGADIVFLDDSSSSASEIDNGGETDFINDDERVTIKTPTIDFDCQFSDTETKIPPSTMLQNNKEYFNTKSIDSHNSVDEKEKNTNDDNVSTCSRPPNAVLSSNDEISESLESLLVLPPTPAACNEVTIMANEFVDEHSTDAVVLNEFVEKSVDIKHDNSKIVENEISNNLNPSGEEMSDHSSKDYSRHDSSSSVCSSHSTSHSTAKYNPQSSSLTDIAALVHDDLQSVPEPFKTDIHENNSVGSFAITKTNRFMNVPGIEDNTNETILNHSDDPVSLKEICLTKVASLPLSDAVLEELVSVSENLNILTRHVQSETESKKFSQEQITTMPFFPSPDLSAVKKAAFAYKNSKLPQDLQSEKLPPPVNPRQSSFKMLREDPPWVGLASQTDPTMLACLSPSQKSQIELTKNTTNDEAAELIDMHCKYAERRGYHETSASAEKPPPASNNIDDKIPVHASGGDGRAACSPGSTNRLLAIIRDPQVSSDAKQNTSDKQNATDKQSPPHSTFDFMETLRSFEDLNTNLAKQEKNISVSKRSDSIKESLEISESYSSNQSYKANVRKGSSDEIGFTRNSMHFSEYSPVNTRLSVKEEYNSSDKNKSNDNIINHSRNTNSENKYYYNSMGNLNSQEDTNAYVQRYHNKRAFLLDDPIFDSLTDNVRQNKTSHSSKTVVPPRRSSLPKEFHDRQIAYIIQKEKEIEEQIKQLEEQKRFTNFERRRVSSGPRAPMIKDDNFPAENYNISRQRDIAIIQQEMDDHFVSSVSKTERPLLSVSAPSNGEKFRDQMYSEYMDKVAEREERKHQKVIKISNSQDCSSSSNTINEIKQACNKIEEEFISKAKLRWDKLGFKDPETEDENETDTAPKNEKDSLIATENQPVVIEHKIKVIEGDEEKDVQKLPNHLQEFVKFTSSGDEAGECSGDISPKSDASVFVVLFAIVIVMFAVGKSFWFCNKNN